MNKLDKLSKLMSVDMFRQTVLRPGRDGNTTSSTRGAFRHQQAPPSPRPPFPWNEDMFPKHVPQHDIILRDIRMDRC